MITERNLMICQKGKKSQQKNDSLTSRDHPESVTIAALHITLQETVIDETVEEKAEIEDERKEGDKTKSFNP